MERTKCKLCSRTFANGRALGGHMKAHFATLPLPPPESTSVSSASHFPGSSSRDSAYEEFGDDKSSIYGPRGNPRRSLKFSDPEFSSLIGATPVSPDEEESEADSSRRRRPKRARKKLYTAAEEEDDDEDAAIAMCLVMLSRDNRTPSAPAKGDVKRNVCEICNKSFRSSQALGGHRVTHRKISSFKGEAEKSRKNFKFLDDDESEKIFECPYCSKVFGSGQALGGHKRSHSIIGSENGQRPSLSSGKGRSQKQSSLIDLNLPASPEEDDDRSVVSDGEIGGRI